MRLKKVSFRDVRQVRVRIPLEDKDDEHVIWIGRRSP